MEARFIGADGSMGLVHNRIYNIQIWSDSNYIFVRWGSRVCPYSNLQKLHENWMVEEEKEDASRHDLQKLIVSLVKEGYEISFRSIFENRSLRIRIRLEDIDKGYCLNKAVPFERMDAFKFDPICVELIDMQKYLERKKKEAEDGQS